MSPEIFSLKVTRTYHLLSTEICLIFNVSGYVGKAIALSSA